MNHKPWKRLIVLSLVLLLVTGIAGACLTPTPTPHSLAPPEVTIADLQGERWKEFVNQRVTVSGIFVADPVPMLVTDLELVLMNMPMRPDQYLVLQGAVTRELDARKYGGARVEATGLVAALPRREGAVPAGWVALQLTAIDVIDRLRPYHPSIVKVFIEQVQLLPDRYAILFSGGIDSSHNYVRYWNDLKFMYSTLVNQLGFPTDHIAVLYADGTGRDTDMPVDRAATQANLQTEVTDLSAEVQSNDTVFIFTTNHGGSFYPAKGSQADWYGGRLDNASDELNDNIKEQDYNKDLNGNGNKTDTVSWDEQLHTWGAQIYDDDLRTMLAAIKCDTMIVVMEQCFSGGMIYDLRGTGRIVISAAGEYEPSYASATQSYNYDEFSYYFTSALNKAKPDGTAVNADANGDGHVSMVEAFNYARSQDAESETPWYEDSGDGVPHSGNMPSGGDGTLGGSTWLD